jgi:hypothetical protein
LIDALVSAIPFEKSNPIRVMDLGCGSITKGQFMAVDMQWQLKNEYIILPRLPFTVPFFTNR